MTTARQATIELQDKVLDSIRVGQKATLDSVRSWSSTVEAFVSKLPELAVPDTTIKPTEFLESAFAFSEKVLAGQREFANQLFEAALPAARSATTAAQSARATAAKV